MNKKQLIASAALLTSFLAGCGGGSGGAAADVPPAQPAPAQPAPAPVQPAPAQPPATSPNVKFGGSPVIQTMYTADPAPMVHEGTLYLFSSHDEDVGEKTTST